MKKGEALGLDDVLVCQKCKLDLTEKSVTKLPGGVDVGTPKQHDNSGCFGKKHCERMKRNNGDKFKFPLGCTVCGLEGVWKKKVLGQ